MQKFQLDFSIYYSKDRLDAIKKIDLKKLNKNELELVTNYVLYGKDEDGLSIVDKKYVQIKTKFNSYAKEKTVSLDEMLESPTFDESILQKNRTFYKKGKPQIDKEKAAQIPEMKALWDEIDKLAQIVDENSGKVEKTSNTPTLSERELYYLKHYLIQLRSQQYILIDTYFPTIQTKKNRLNYFTAATDYQGNFPILPRGVVRSEHDNKFQFPRLDDDKKTNFFTDEYFDSVINSGKPYFDFRNKEHIYQLVLFYEEIEEMVRNCPDSILNNLLWTLDFYIEKANLSEQQLLIIEDKKKRKHNSYIAKHLQDELGFTHQENYISTIWNKALNAVVDAAELNYDEYLCRGYDKAWKTCCNCGKELLRDSRNFVKKSKALDGLTGRCKKCDKLLRQNKINK